MRGSAVRFVLYSGVYSALASWLIRIVSCLLLTSPGQ